MDWKNIAEMYMLLKASLRVNANPYQNFNAIFHRTRKNNPKTCETTNDSE